jgi:hypothetical protein
MSNKFATRKYESSDWFIDCPKCARTVTIQTKYVTEFRDPNFHCRFCDAKGELVARQSDGKVSLK